MSGLSLRRRIAALLWIPGAALVLVVGELADSWIVGVVAFIALLAALWIFAERGDRIAARLRRRKQD